MERRIKEPRLWRGTNRKTQCSGEIQQIDVAGGTDHILDQGSPRGQRHWQGQIRVEFLISPSDESRGKMRNARCEVLQASFYFTCTKSTLRALRMLISISFSHFQRVKVKRYKFFVAIHD